jgi:carbon-monoxide dehydrogenase medium subunit
MHPLPFTFHKATSVDDALALLADHEDDGKLLSGGQSLLPVMKLRLAAPSILIDISGLAELAGVTKGADGITIGALTTHATLATSDVPLLAEIANTIGDQQVRNLGTIGGALAHADPAADYPAGALALDVTLVARGPNGDREIPIAEFFQGFMTTGLAANEILTEIRVPAFPAKTGFNYQKLSNPASGYAIVGVAAIVTLGDDGAIAEAKIGITGAADMAYRATSVEDALRGQHPDEASVKAAVVSAVEGQELLSDVQADADYRAKVTPNLVRRAVLTAVSRIG